MEKIITNLLNHLGLPFHQCLLTYPLKVTRFKVTWTLKLSNLENVFRQLLGCEAWEILQTGMPFCCCQT